MVCLTHWACVADEELVAILKFVLDSKSAECLSCLRTISQDQGVTQTEAKNTLLYLNDGLFMSIVSLT